MNKTRDRWNSGYNFNYVVAKAEAYVEKCKGKVRSCEDNKRALQLRFLFGAVDGLFEEMYIRGDDLENLKPIAEDLMLVAQQYTQACQLEGGREQGLISIEMEYIWTIAFLRMCGFSDEQMKIIADAFIKVDELTCTERLLQVYSPTRVQFLKKTTYASGECKQFAKILESPLEKMPMLLKGYLDKWKKLRYGCHSEPGVLPDGDPIPWNGFWCYPVAALVATLNLDDSEFIDHEYYPTDLMLEFRKHKGALRALPPLNNKPDSGKSLPETPTKRRAPEQLKPFSGLFDTTTQYMPESLKLIVWNALVDEVKELIEDGDELEADTLFNLINNAQIESGVCGDYNQAAVLVADWKDTETALDLARDLANTVGISEAFDVDDSEGVWRVLYEFNQWLSSHGDEFIAIDTGEDYYAGFIVSNKHKRKALTKLKKYQIDIHAFAKGQEF